MSTLIFKNLQTFEIGLREFFQMTPEGYSSPNLHVAWCRPIDVDFMRLLVVCKLRCLLYIINDPGLNFFQNKDLIM